MKILIYTAILFLSACASTMPKLPDKVTVVVKEFKPLPSWAKKQLQIPQRKDGTVSSILKADDEKTKLLEFVNCRSALLDKLDNNEEVSINICDGK